MFLHLGERQMIRLPELLRRGHNGLIAELRVLLGPDALVV